MALRRIVSARTLLLAWMTAAMSGCATYDGAAVSSGASSPSYDISQLQGVRDTIDGKRVLVSGYLNGDPTHFGLYEFSGVDDLDADGRYGRCSGKKGGLIGVEFEKGHSPDRARLKPAGEADGGRRVLLSGRFDKERVQVGVNGLFLDYDASLKDATVLKYEDSSCGVYPKPK